MIDDRFLIFIILLVLTYAFDHKIIPTVGVFAMAVVEFAVLLDGTVTQTDSYYIMLIIINMIYCGFMVFASNEPGNETDMIL